MRIPLIIAAALALCGTAHAASGHTVVATAEAVVDKVEHAASTAITRTGEAVKKGAQKTGEAIEKGAHKTGEAVGPVAAKVASGVEHAAHVVEQKAHAVAASGPGSSSGNAAKH